MRERQQFNTLNGIRGVAALAVVLFHVSVVYAWRIRLSGYLAVDLFFVLSGFVVANAYEDRLLSSMSLRAFIWARVIRFYPLYVAGLLLGTLTSVVAMVVSPARTMSAGAVGAATALGLFFLPAPVDRDHNLYPLNVPAWSLLFELLVNLVYAACVRLLSTATIMAIAALSGTAFAIFVMARGDASLGAWAGDFGAGLTRTVFSFSVGVLIYRVRPQLPPLGPPVILFAVAALLLAPIPTDWRVAYDLGFVFVMSPLLIAIGSAVEPSGWAAPACRYLGEISFAIYAVHYPLLWLAHGLEKAARHGLGPLSIGLLVAGLLVGCPMLVRLYDEPLRRRLSRPRLQLVAAE